MSNSHEGSHPRLPWLALALSLCCPGLGQLYCGRAARGLVMFAAFALFGPAMVALALITSSTAGLLLFIACMLAYVVAAICVAVDAHRIARRLNGRDFTLRDYNQLAVYVLLSLASISSSLGLAHFLRATVMEAFFIPTSSMSPTLLAGDRILANKLGISTRSFERGDLVVFRNPENRRQLFVKRIIGMPGDSLEIKQQELLINGKPVDRGPENGHVNNLKFSDQAVPAGSYFVLGDNREFSHDSRDFGFLSHGEITGVVTYLYWPAVNWTRFGSVK